MKEQACRMVLESKMPVRIVAERFNVGLQLLYRWIGQYETYGDEAFVGSGKLRSEDTKLRNSGYTMRNKMRTDKNNYKAFSKRNSKHREVEN